MEDKTNLTPTQKKPIVLVVDDSDDHRFLVQKAAKKIDLYIEWRSIESGADAINYITGRGKYSDRTSHPLPTLMLLDLKMPGVTGFEVLSTLMEKRVGKPPFICVMSSSDLKEDIEKSRALGADVFYTKPSSFDNLCVLLQCLTLKFCSGTSR